MDLALTHAQLVAAGLSGDSADDILAALDGQPESAVAKWDRIAREYLSPTLPFAAHVLIHDHVFADWKRSSRPAPAWTPTDEEIARTNIAAAYRRAGVGDYETFRRWSIDERAAFWWDAITTLGIRFRTPPAEILDTSSGVESALWLRGARMNVADNCFLSPPDDTAIIYQREGGHIEKTSYAELESLSNRVANSLGAIGVGKGAAIAIAMPMTVEAVAAYLGIVKAGAVVVSIADSFAPGEIATRMRIVGARAAITQDVVVRAGKQFSMYEKVVAADVETIVVATAGESLAVELRESDTTWKDFLVSNDIFDSVSCDPDDTTNILFSSGTTGEPKAIPWTHATPLKCAVDALYHQDIHPGNVVAWPTNLGWMMGPWLIYASMVNRGTMALYYGAPNTREFCEFVQDAHVNMLGVVPSLVKAWRGAGAVEGLDWSAINAFSSTGEASNPEDMLWLMSRAGYRPVVEYCGGTEIGGGYITQTLVQAARPATFSTTALGLDVHVLDAEGRSAADGEMFIVPPSIGLSRTLINRDHHDVYYSGTPPGPNGETLRRHGDQMGCIGGGYYRALGRADDTMNLSGIKISSAEIERVVSGIEGVLETAAIAVDPDGGGPSRLVIYAVLEPGTALGTESLKGTMQKSISASLNPLFRVHQVVVIDALPRTASNKVMRRVLRERHGQSDTAAP